VIWLNTASIGTVKESRAIRVLCVDDNVMVADAIEGLLGSAGGFEWVGHFCSADNLLDAVQRRCPDVVLLDIDMPGKNAFEAVMELREHCPTSRVLMLSALVRRDLVDRAVDAGAWGYISKRDGGAIVNAVRRVAEGEFVIGQDVAALYSN
jgi:DNA-binding NarL/FixJ family response regulator